MTPDLVLAALRGVHDPDLRADIVSLKFVKNLEVADGRAAFTIELSSPSVAARDTVREAARAAVAAVPGITSVDVTMAFSVRATSAPEHGKPPLPGVKNVIAVGAGKGGVGKTTVAVNLAVALSKLGARVGMLDGDIYGPNVPIMFGLQAQLQMDGKVIRPAEKYGIQIVSMGFLAQDEAPMIWRGPMLHSAIQQFCRDVGWKDLDYLIVDMPPGHRRRRLVAEPDRAGRRRHCRDHAAAGVARRQQARGADVPEAQHPDARAWSRTWRSTSAPTAITRPTSSAMAAASRWRRSSRCRSSAGCRIYQPIRVGGDRGIPLVIAEPESVAAKAFTALAEATVIQIAVAAQKNAITHKGKIPLVHVK